MALGCPKAILIIPLFGLDEKRLGTKKAEGRWQMAEGRRRNAYTLERRKKVLSHSSLSPHPSHAPLSPSLP